MFLSAVQLPDLTVRLNFGASRAKRFTLLYSAPGEAEFTPLGLNRHRVFGSNDAGNGTPSLVLEFNVAQEAAA